MFKSTMEMLLDVIIWESSGYDLHAFPQRMARMGPQNSAFSHQTGHVIS
jgi:hypothetical protein